MTRSRRERVMFTKCIAAFILALICLTPTTSRARENLALDKYTCADFLRDAGKPDNGSKVLKSMMMISWATGYASGAWEDFARADASAFAQMGGVLGAACRKHRRQKAVRVIARLVRQSSIAGAATRTGPIFSGNSLVTDLQRELDRVGCDPGSIDGRWGRDTERALEQLNRVASLGVKTDGPTTQALYDIRGISGHVCSSKDNAENRTGQAKPTIKLGDLTPAYCRQYWPNGVKLSWTRATGVGSGGPVGRANMRVIMQACGRQPE